MSSQQADACLVCCVNIHYIPPHTAYLQTTSYTHPTVHTYKHSVHTLHTTLWYYRDYTKCIDCTLHGLHTTNINTPHTTHITHCGLTNTPYTHCTLRTTKLLATNISHNTDNTAN